jgi:hypothetical protein
MAFREARFALGGVIRLRHSGGDDFHDAQESIALDIFHRERVRPVDPNRIAGSRAGNAAAQDVNEA